MHHTPLVRYFISVEYTEPDISTYQGIKIERSEIPCSYIDAHIDVINLGQGIEKDWIEVLERILYNKDADIIQMSSSCDNFVIDSNKKYTWKMDKTLGEIITAI
jgi:hypothetical protein